MSVSSAGGFDQARGSAIALALRPIFDERMKLRFGQHPQKLVQASALCENCLQGPSEQSVELETRRTRRANASNIALLSDVKPVAREGNGCVSVGVSKIIASPRVRRKMRLAHSANALRLRLRAKCARGIASRIDRINRNKRNEQNLDEKF